MLDLSVLKTAPDFAAKGLLTVEALAPLSLVVKMPGKYYRSQPQPSEMMLLAMLENALGWHIAEVERNQLLRRLGARHQSPVQKSNVGFGSLLQWHVRFVFKHIPASMHYDDLWSQHLKHSDERHINGARNHDASAIGPMNEALRTGMMNVKELRPRFPQYYVSPTPREFIVPDGPFRYRIETSPALAELLSQALERPDAPLYLGSSEGWVEATWETLHD